MLINQAQQPGEPAVFGAAQLEAVDRSARSSCSSRRSASPTTSPRSTRRSRTTYPQSYPLSTSAQQLVSDAQTRWQNALAGFQDAMHGPGRRRAEPRHDAHPDRRAWSPSSQSAIGALQALQSGNQLIALQTKQLADLTAVIAAIARAQSLEGARTIENQEQAQVQLSQFLNYGTGYQPQTVQMFH